MLFDSMVSSVVSRAEDLGLQAFQKREKIRDNDAEKARYADELREAFGAQFTAIKLGGPRMKDRLVKLAAFTRALYLDAGIMADTLPLKSDPNGAPYDYIMEMCRDILLVYSWLQAQIEGSDERLVVNYYDRISKMTAEQTLWSLCSYEKEVYLLNRGKGMWPIVQVRFAATRNPNKRISRYSRYADIAASQFLLALRRLDYKAMRTAYREYAFAVSMQKENAGKLKNKMMKAVYGFFFARNDLDNIALIIQAGQFRQLLIDLLEIAKMYNMAGASDQ